MNPNTTFTEFNHPPDFGNLLIMLGKAAKTAKGSPKAIPKPLIAAVIGHGPFFNAEPKTVPKIGPVQEKETKASVNAMKKIPKVPPTCDAESALLVNDAGKVISK